MEELLEVVQFHLPRYENTVKICKSSPAQVNPSDLTFAMKFAAIYLFIKVKGSCPMTYQYLTGDMIAAATVLCKSNANDNRRISRFVLAIYRRYISETSHRLANVKTINHRDISTIFAISRRDIALVRLRCNDISQSKTIYHHDISLQRSSL